MLNGKYILNIVDGSLCLKSCRLTASSILSILFVYLFYTASSILSILFVPSIHPFLTIKCVDTVKDTIVHC